MQSTVKEMAKEVQSSRSGEIKQTAEALDEFMNKVFLSHAHGVVLIYVVKSPSNESLFTILGVMLPLFTY